MVEVGWGGLDSVQGRVSLLFLLNKYVQKGSKKVQKCSRLGKDLLLTDFLL